MATTAEWIAEGNGVSVYGHDHGDGFNVIVLGGMQGMRDVQVVTSREIDLDDALRKVVPPDLLEAVRAWIARRPA